MALSVYLADKLNDHVLKGVTYTPPTDVYIALFTSVNGLEQNDSGLWDEVSGGSYARLQIDDTTLKFTASSGGSSSNNENWEFPKATAAWGIVSHTAVMDDPNAGNVLMYGALTSSRDIQIDDVFRFLAGEFDSIF